MQKYDIFFIYANFSHIFLKKVHFTPCIRTHHLTKQDICSRIFRSNISVLQITGLVLSYSWGPVCSLGFNEKSHNRVRTVSSCTTVVGEIYVFIVIILLKKLCKCQCYWMRMPCALNTCRSRMMSSVPSRSTFVAACSSLMFSTGVTTSVCSVNANPRRAATAADCPLSSR